MAEPMLHNLRVRERVNTYTVLNMIQHLTDKCLTIWSVVDKRVYQTDQSIRVEYKIMFWYFNISNQCVHASYLWHPKTNINVYTGYTHLQVILTPKSAVKSVHCMLKSIIIIWITTKKTKEEDPAKLSKNINIKQTQKTHLKCGLNNVNIWIYFAKVVLAKLCANVLHN